MRRPREAWWASIAVSAQRPMDRSIWDGSRRPDPPCSPPFCDAAGGAGRGGARRGEVGEPSPPSFLTRSARNEIQTSATLASVCSSSSAPSAEIQRQRAPIRLPFPGPRPNQSTARRSSSILTSGSGLRPSGHTCPAPSVRHRHPCCPAPPLIPKHAQRCAAS